MVSAGCLVLVVLISSYLANSAALAVYALSFWHYLLYWWAYRHGAASPARFRRDAVAMKTVALVALAVVYLPMPAHALSIAVVAAGFLLNGLGARALGPARTYYGWELGDVSHQRVTTFPYSVVSHPMLLGNLAAYGGMLLNPEFRAQWWPLGCGHVLLNLGLLLMETAITPGRPGLGLAHHEPALDQRGAAGRGPTSAGACLAAVAGAAMGTLVAGASGWPGGYLPCAAVGASAALHTALTAGWYVFPSGPFRPVAHPE